MNDRHTEVMSALVDGERVDPDVLRDALEDAAARRALLDFLRLREAASEAGTPLPSSLTALRRGPLWRRAVPLPAAAALVLLALLTSWMLVSSWPRADRPSDPPVPVRSVSFEPGVDWELQTH